MAAVAPVPLPAARQKQSFGRLFGFQSDHSRYTIAKFRDYDTYARTTTSRRHSIVIFLAPVPAFLSSLLPTFIPLQDPALGVLKNTWFLLHFAVTLGLVMYGSVHQMQAPNGISRADLSHLDAVFIAVTGAGLLTAVATLMGYAWRFPVPFIWVTALAPYTVTFVLGYVIVLRQRLWRNDLLWRPLLRFLPAYVFQSSQVVIYPIFSAVFEVADVWGQVALTLAFPLVKFFYRAVTRRLLSHLEDDANEVAVTGIEICATMYQSMIMQSTPSVYATAIVMILDAGQNFLHIYIYMAQKSTIPQAQLVPTARHILFGDGKGTGLTERDLQSTAILQVRRASSVRPSPLLRTGTGSAKTIAPGTKPSAPRSATLSRSASKRIVRQALAILESSESIVLIEYLEVAVPCGNAYYSVIASQFDSAVYNPKLRTFYYDQRLLGPAMTSLALYTALQALSLIVVYMLLKRRFGVDARALLAFVLERHAWSLQGKLITWLSLLFQFPVAHYGVDFKFHFDFARAHMGRISKR